MMTDSTKMDIPRYFAGKTVALTGGTGFIGQCLIEKLLRSCPKVKKILVFIRQKRNDDAASRLKKLSRLPIFDALRKLHPNFENKLHAIPCDLEKSNLGLKEHSKLIIVNEVEIFLHSAATLRFNEPLRFAFKVNTLAVQAIVRLCKEIKNLQVLCHISTAYSFCNRKNIGEEVYDVGQDYKKLEESLLWMTDDMVEKLTPDILKDRPNTYTLTKAFGEEVVSTEGTELPICIVRPSIVGAAYDEPLQGWCTNLNGPNGLFAAYGKGLLRSLCTDNQTRVDIIPSDFVVNGIIAAAWKTGVQHLEKNTRSLDCLPEELSSHHDGETQLGRKDVPLYHLVVGEQNPVHIEKWRAVMKQSFMNYPLDDAVLIPVLNVTTNKHLYNVLAFVMEYLPAYIFDLGLTMFGKKPKLMKLNKRIAGNVKVLQFFIANQWIWDRTSSNKLLEEMSPSDKEIFNFDPKTIDWQKYMNRYAIGLKKYLLKEDLKRYPAERRHLKRLRILGYIGQGILFMVVWRLLVSRTRIARNLWHLLISFGFKFVRYFQISSTLNKTSFLVKWGKALLA